MCMWFGYNIDYFFSLFLLCELNFLHEMLSKCIDSGYLVGATPLSFPLIILKLCRCFLHEMKMCMWFWYNILRGNKKYTDFGFEYWVLCKWLR